MSIAFWSGQYSNIIVLCRGLGKGTTSLFKLKIMISRLGSKISKNVPGISRVIHRDASIAKFFLYTKKRTETRISL